ncbi:MAG TPA: DUF429 domain-containing protein [Burkholderiales bacterium]|nr:DUF429 domain-containing protein [Burkholderiales bacterium]
MPKAAGWSVHGVDFTSRPRVQKAITVASGRSRGSVFHLDNVEDFADWAHFECWLRRPGPWIAGFDFPFGLPREAVDDLRWPKRWPQLVAYCRRQGRDGFRAALDRYRESRPTGKRYAHRTADRPAGSHSPLKLVNPPVGFMFLEGAPRLLDAGVNIPGLHPGDPQRVALEAYPGFSARQMVKGSYKNDAPRKQTPARRQARKSMVRALTTVENPFGFALAASTRLMNSLVSDATGDRLDAVLCAMQAAWAWRRRGNNYGMPLHVDPLEGWIATVPPIPAAP